MTYWSSSHAAADVGAGGVGAEPVALVRARLGEVCAVAHPQGALHDPLGLRLQSTRHTAHSWLVEGASRVDDLWSRAWIVFLVVLVTASHVTLLWHSFQIFTSVRILSYLQVEYIYFILRYTSIDLFYIIRFGTTHTSLVATTFSLFRSRLSYASCIPFILSSCYWKTKLYNAAYRVVIEIEINTLIINTCYSLAAIFKRIFILTDSVFELLCCGYNENLNMQAGQETKEEDCINQLRACRTLHFRYEHHSSWSDHPSILIILTC